MTDAMSSAIALTTSSRLCAALEAAVPLRIREIRQSGMPWDVIQQRAAECAQAIAEKGDVLQFGGGRRGDAALAMSALIDGLAYLAFAPGGVRVFGVHFEAALEEA